MRDIPVFTTENGVAEIVLREIPYKKRAHIKLRATQEPEKLLDECVSFCRVCGAEQIYAAGHDFLEKYPLYVQMLEMTCTRETVGKSDAALVPVMDRDMELWLQIHNGRMAEVPNAAYLDSKDGQEFLENGDCYFVHRDGKLLGIGKGAEDRIDIVVAAEPGMGETVVRALCSVLTGDRVRVAVAAENERAVRLYERMGFVCERMLSQWYQIL